MDQDLDARLDARLDALVDRNQELLACPYPLFAELRAAAPVHWNEHLGAWVITRYEDVLAVLHDTERFSSAMPTGPEKRGRTLGAALQSLTTEPEMAPYLAYAREQMTQSAVLLNADPPDHVRQRKLVNGAFRPKRLAALEPFITQVAAELAADLAQTMAVNGSGELVAELGVPLPMTVIAAALGVDTGHLDTFKQWSDDLVMPVGNHSPTVDQVRGYLISNKELAEYFSALLADRQAHPSDDILSDVANAALDGEGLTQSEQLSMLTQFLVAGNETTTKLLTNMVNQLALDPHLQARVRADRSLVDGLVEESLRFEAPVGGLFRRAVTDVDLGGDIIAAGQHVWVLYAAANRDPGRFDQPDHFDPGRANARDHLAFGHGEHYCIGAGLARAEARIGINAILDALHHITLSPGHPVEFEDTFVLRGMRHLHLSYTPDP